MQTITHSHPANLDAERAIIAGCLESADILSAVLHEGLTPDDFSVTDHQQIWEAVLQMSDAALPVSIVSLVDYCPAISLPALVDLTFGAVLLEAHILHYIAIVKRCAKLRRLLHVGCWLAKEAVTIGADPNHLLIQLHQKISGELEQNPRGECHE